MPAPFPGMDPFIESQKWRDFHATFIPNLSNELTAVVRPRYVVDIDVNVYRVREDGDLWQVILPNFSVVQKSGWPAVDPIEETYLVIRSSLNDEVVTVIELLSPTNKLSRDGRTEYLNKRNAVLHSEANLVEIDLLRGGKRLPTVETLPKGDYFAFVTRVERRPTVEVYSWPLERTLPKIPIPLAEGDPDVMLDLQAVFDTTYDRAGYDYSLKYSKPVEPPLSKPQTVWVVEMLAKVKIAT